MGVFKGWRNVWRLKTPYCVGAKLKISYNEKGFGQTEAIRAYRAGAISEHLPGFIRKPPGKMGTSGKRSLLATYFREMWFDGRYTSGHPLGERRSRSLH